MEIEEQYKEFYKNNKIESDNININIEEIEEIEEYEEYLQSKECKELENIYKNTLNTTEKNMDR